jgi:hypothetical protein
LDILKRTSAFNPPVDVLDPAWTVCVGWVVAVGIRVGVGVGVLVRVGVIGVFVGEGVGVGDGAFGAFSAGFSGPISSEDASCIGAGVLSARGFVTGRTWMGSDEASSAVTAYTGDTTETNREAMKNT